MEGEGIAREGLSGFGRALRARFMLEDGVAFLNNGSYGATPRAVFDAVHEWRRRVEAEPVRFYAREAMPALAAARAALAARIGADPEGIGFVDNATTAANAVIASLDLAPGDEVLTTDHVYNAVRNALRHWCGRQGAAVIEAPVPYPIADAEQIVAAIEQHITPRTRLLVIDHIASPTALIMPVERLIAHAHARGIRVLVDGAHAPGQLALDLRALGADWYVGNCHKWMYAQRGCGFLYAASAERARVHPTVISHGYGNGLAAEFDWTGTRDLCHWLALPAAFAFADELGPQRIAGYNRALRAAGARLIAERWGTAVGAPPELLGFMAAIRVPGSESATPERAQALHDALFDRHKVEVPIICFAGALWARISAQIFNEIADYERLADAMAPRA
jgi:isopenicillin-N epimerase